MTGVHLHGYARNKKGRNLIQVHRMMDQVFEGENRAPWVGMTQAFMVLLGFFWWIF